MLGTLSMSASEPSLNLGSPRTRAAMKVLGILPSDVRQQDVEFFGGDREKHKLFEQKRSHIIDEVRRKASTAPDVSGKHGADGGMTREERNALFMEQVANTEKENMARMAKMAKKDVQSVIIQELETKLTAHQNMMKQQESKMRMKALLKARDEELDARKKLAEKKQDKILDVRTKALEKMLHHSEEIQETIRKKNERATKSVQAISDGRLEGRAQNKEKREKIFQRQEGYEADQLREREHAYAEHVEKMDSKVRMLEEKNASRASHTEELAHKEQQCRDNVRVHAEEKQAAVETKYWEAIGRHSDAAKKRDESLKLTIKEYQVKNVKRKLAHEGRYDKIQEGVEKNIVRKYEEFEKKDENFEKTRALARASSDAVLATFFDHRRHCTDLSADNRQRLRRAHHYGTEQQLDKLVQMRRKVQIMEGSKEEADHRRATVVAKCAVEKMHLTDRVDRAKNSKDPEKMQKMLEDLDPDPDAIGRINELLSELGMQTLGFVKDEGEDK
mmetsp:Transcript_28659/g.92120  ORF Transcript_28659/g.92120 Transcript_28659/m.92120 type:complete len:503 (+) Transcript_28659:96-1604(+)